MRALRRVAQLMAALLRELADENAYRRHLSSRRQPHSAAEWRLFSDRRLRNKYGRPKCC